MLKSILTILAMVIILTGSFSNTYSQAQISLGTDLVSRYVWRGIDFGKSPSIQPTIAFGYSGLEVGAWGAYQLGRDSSTPLADEIDLYIGYSLDIGETSLSFVATDYYFPTSGKKFGNFKDDGLGSHIIEVGVTLAGSESLPFYLSAYINVYNEVDNSSYFEIGYSTSVQDVGLSFFAGATPGGVNLYYGTTNFNVINLGVTAGKDIKITDDFSLPIFGSFIVNPNQENIHMVFGVSL